MASYTYTNVTDQGLNVTYVVGVETKHKLVGSKAVVSFTADSLTPATQSLVDAGHLVVGGSGSTVQTSAVAAVAITLVGSYQSTVQYKKGHVVKYNSIYYIGLRTSTGAQPDISTSDWEVFGGPSTGTLGAHTADTSNPHSVTATQAGAIPTADKAAANGVASLDATTKIPLAQIPNLTTQTQVATLLADTHPINKDTVLDSGGANQVTAANLAAHLASSSNPHTVTAAQVSAIATSLKGAANGVAELDSSTQVPVAQLSYAISTVQTVADITARDALTPKQGDFVKVTDAGSSITKSYMYSGSAWIEIVTSSPVISVNGSTGVVVLTTTDVAEGSNLYYTAGRVTAHTDVAANTAARHNAGTDTALDTGNPNEVTAGALRAHLDNTSNPHAVTASDVGALANVVEDLSPTLGAALAAGGFKITGLADPTLAQDAATKNYADTTFLPLLAGYVTKAGSYIITSAESGKIIRFTAVATATLPNGLAAGFQVVIAKAGAGDVTVAADGTLNSKGTKITTQYSAATFTHIGSNVWEGYGDLVT